ncbi:MAG: bifunctional folylpolyglutamate synthase/dihydrofolate synthase [Dehalococcoidales bacterium]|nr:bifunctional folylpolyglutamate synthase/dihydrofolate synthase [Dehalococcoidales bacterium]
MISEQYQSALDYIYSLVDFESRSEPNQARFFDLRRMELLLAELGNPHHKAKSIHVAGTKGKGSTAAMIAAVLSRAGYKTGLYSSPHLIDLTERISVNGKDITREELVSLTEDIRPVIERINSRAKYGEVTTFELLTAMGFVYFAGAAADFQVLETGLGGRLDATNVINPLVAVITLIGLDHTAVLGDTLALIAAEKAGIIKNGCTVVSAGQPAAAAEVIRRVSREKNARLVEAASSIKCYPAGYENEFQLFELISAKNTYHVKLPLLGAYQKDNLCCAVLALEEIAEKGTRLTKAIIEEGLRQVKWPGRFQIVSTHPLVIVDGAHNPEAIKALLASLQYYLAGHNSDSAGKTLIFGTSRDKDIAGMVSLFKDYFSRIIITRAAHPRSMDTEIIKESLAGYKGEVILAGTVNQALQKALSSVSPDELVIAAGSLFIVGEALAGLKAAGVL